MQSRVARTARKLVVGSVCFAAILWLGVAIYIFAAQDRFVFQPVRGATTAPSGFGNRSITTKTGAIEFWEAEPEIGAAKGTVLYLHGNGGNLNNTIGTLTAWRKMATE